jgi:Sel1 repeat
MHDYRKVGAAALALIGAALLRPAAGATDAVFIESGAPEPRTASSYESDYVAEAQRHGLGENTPEADARPGEVFFLRAAQAVRKRDYALAVQMYEVSASWAYKPAEYNLGVMYARGQGVAADLPRAMAWMALAAERNDKHYVDAREAVYASLSKEQFDQANAIWRELKKTYGDEVALVRAKRRWAEVKSHMTGSRVGSPGNLVVGTPAVGAGLMGPPKIVVPARGGGEGKSVPPPRPEGAHSGITSAAEVTGGTGVDGSIAYRQLRESDNPYDPKFKNLPTGTAIVGPPEPVRADAAKDTQPPATDEPDPAGGQR